MTSPKHALTKHTITRLKTQLNILSHCVLDWTPDLEHDRAERAHSCTDGPGVEALPQGAAGSAQPYADRRVPHVHLGESPPN